MVPSIFFEIKEEERKMAHQWEERKEVRAYVGTTLSEAVSERIGATTPPARATKMVKVKVPLHGGVWMHLASGRGARVSGAHGKWWGLVEGGFGHP